MGLNRSASELVSVVIPTYNRQGTVAEAVASVLAQTYGAFEAIVVDDGSTDRTEHVVRSFKDDRVRYARIPHSGLPAAGRNKGLELATGDFIAFLDSDDVWLPHKLERQLAALRRFPDLSGVASDAIEFGNGPERPIRSLWRDRRVRFRDLLVTNPIINSTVLIKADVVKQVGTLDEAPQLRASEDFDYWLRILHHKDGSLLLLKDCLIRYRTHAGNLASVFSDQTLAEEKRYAFAVRKYEKERPRLVEQAIAAYSKRMRKVRATISLYSGAVTPGRFWSTEGLSVFERIFILLKFALKTCLASFKS